MMVTAGKDKVLLPKLSDHMPQYIPNLKREHIEDSTHWILIEQPDLCNKYIAEFLDSLKF
ncbi:Bifunctional epoxide hydrolase 2 [Basidiobolus ranarum]|uniref:Bifunctional epoxide hydrolase 2 n=1 Tax=Basidiobolus ranarum TaxID=34480 RepID=A0ABR2WBL4_9FUNG